MSVPNPFFSFFFCLRLFVLKRAFYAVDFDVKVISGK